MYEWLSYFGAVALLSRVRLPLGCISSMQELAQKKAYAFWRKSICLLRKKHMPFFRKAIGSKIKGCLTLGGAPCSPEFVAPNNSLRVIIITYPFVYFVRWTPPHNWRCPAINSQNTQAKGSVCGNGATCGLLRGSLPSGEGRAARSKLPPQGLRLRASSARTP